MKRFVEGLDRGQSTACFADRLEDWIGDDNPVRVIDGTFVLDELDLGGLGFGRVAPRATGRPGYHPSVLLHEALYLRLPQPIGSVEPPP